MTGPRAISTRPSRRCPVGMVNFLLFRLFGPVPTALVARTVHLYFLPGVSRLTLIGLEDPLLLRVLPPFLLVQVTEYDVTGLPPSEVSRKLILAFRFDTGTAELMTGRPGAELGGGGGGGGAGTSTVAPNAL